MARTPTRAVLGLALLTAGSAWATSRLDTLTVVSWGGRYTASQMEAYVEPFREITDLHVEVDDYTGGLTEVRAQVTAHNVEWDVVDMGLASAMRGCEEGLLEPIDPAILAEDGGKPPTDDFLEGTLHRCAVGQNVFATVVAWDPREFDETPDEVADFFDVKQFPGKRGLRRHPQVAMEWALLADGVAPDELYTVLDSKRGVKRAFKVLEDIAPHIVWWEGAAEPMALLESGQVSMTSTYNGRAQAALEEGSAAVQILWDAQVRDVEAWVIPTGTRKPEAARQFIAFASQPERMAEQARHIAYGPARHSAMDLLDPEHRERLPTAEANSQRVIQTDYAWWTEHQADLEDQFERWVQRQERLQQTRGAPPPR